MNTYIQGDIEKKLPCTVSIKIKFVFKIIIIVISTMQNFHVTQSFMRQ